jgi:hypothetical protein
MSRKHPTLEELEKKALNIEAERAKMGKLRRVPRLFQTPFSVLRPWLKATHDLRGPCSRPDCAFRNMTAAEEVTVQAMEGKTPDLVKVQ